MKKICFFILLLFGHYAYADDCTIGGVPASSWVKQNYNITFPSPISVGRDTPPGTFLGNASQIRPALGAVSTLCISKFAFHTVASAFLSRSGISGIYKTNVPGVGIQMSTKTTGSWWEDDDDIYNSNIYNWNMPYLFKLVRTNEPLSGGTVTPSVISQTSLLVYSTGANYPLFTVTLTSPVVVNVKACTVNTANINVPLGDIPIGNFTGTGVTTGSKNFSVQLNCDQGTSVKATLSGTQSSETSLSSVLALTNAGSSGVATGVGVQILYGSTPIVINSGTQTSMGALPTSATVNLSARYYQTKSSVTPGLANATATLNLTYQ